MRSVSSAFAGGGRNEYRAQSGDCGLAREDAGRSAADLRMLEPPHFAAIHVRSSQGSAAISARAADSARVKSSCGARA